MLRRPAICSFVLLMLVITPVLSATAVSVKTKTTSVAAFKNGLGFFVREGTATLTDGWATSDEVPTAALGTFWVGSPKAGVSVERLLALQEDSTRTVPAITVAEILEANVGKRVKITYGDKVVEGKLLAVPEDRKATGPVQPVYPASSYIPLTSQSQLVLVETATGTVAITKSSISLVEFEGKVSADHSLQEKVKRLKFKLAGAENSAPITIGYLQKGVSWSPAYLVELLDDNKARITMQGLLVNDVEDIDGADVSFVVGYPNFMFSDMVSPLSLTQSISQFIGSLSSPGSRSGYGGSGGYGGGIMAQSITTNMAGYDYSGQPAPDFGYSSMKETPGAQEEDLFLYHMTNVSLKKGERAYYTVFSAEVAFEHVYKWTVNDTSGVQSNGYVSSNRNESPPPEDQVWHALKLTNSSKFPWTTAPAMAMSKGKPLAQDTLSYTPKGADGDLKLTIATDIRAKTSELEKSRGNNDGSPFNGSGFTKVTSEGTLTLKSFKSRPVTVQVTKTIIGEVTSTGLNGKVEKMGVKLRAVNPTSVVTWDVPLDPGEEKTLDYTYFTYIRY